jgi:hypothetical protein
MSHLRRITAAAMAFGWGVAAAPPALASGALAIDANDGARHGAAFDQATVEAARARALAECGEGCTVVVAFRRFCAAYAADRTPGSRAWGRSGAPTQAEAERKALDNCRLYDGNACQVRLSACDSDAGSGGVASFELEPPVAPDGWSRFEQRVLQDQMPDYTRTRTRRVDYFHPRDMPEGSLTPRLLDDFSISSIWKSCRSPPTGASRFSSPEGQSTPITCARCLATPVGRGSARSIPVTMCLRRLAWDRGR